MRRVLVANRGEIAVRVIRACHELGMQAVAVYSEADRETLAVRLADDAVCIGPGPATRSYLNVPAVLAAARLTGCDAVHPGYGFLAENPALPEWCQQLGIRFVGPTAEHMRLMGDKARAREAAREAGVPITSGSGGGDDDLDALSARAREIGYPVLIKAAAGGGGRGMWRISDEAEMRDALPRARAEAQAAFGDGSVYLEKFVADARHVEIQVIGDSHGNVVQLGERDCSLQRRHQKLLEEAPSPVISEALRDRLQEAAVTLARRCGYINAGTVEFVADVAREEFFFIEMNTRIQVEHPVTEMVTGTDLVAAQLRVAAGEALPWRQDDISVSGHALECRINAEDPYRHFAPTPGRLERFAPPDGIGVRCDTHCFAGYEVPPLYDSMIAKMIVHGRDREQAIARMHAALGDFDLHGVHTTIPFHRALLEDPAVTDGSYNTRWVEECFLDRFASGGRGHAVGEQ